MEQFIQKIIAIKDEAPTIRTFHFERPEGLIWEEGSHLHLAFPGFNAQGRRDPDKIRHMSISSLPGENTIAITTRLNNASPFKTAMASLMIGDEMVLFKIGSRLGLRREDRPLCLLSMGVGLAAFRPLIMEFSANSERIPSVTSLAIVRPGQELFQEELAGFESDHFRHHRYYDRTSYLEGLSSLPQPDSIYYIVGSELFIRDMIRTLRAQGIQDEDIVIDKKPAVREMFFQAMDLISEKPMIF